MFLYRHRSAILALTLLLPACDDDNDDENDGLSIMTEPARFFTDADLNKPSDLKTTNAETLESMLLGWTDIYNEKTDDVEDSTSSTYSEIVSTCYKEAGTTQVIANETSYKTEFNIDIKSCLEKSEWAKALVALLFEKRTDIELKSSTMTQSTFRMAGFNSCPTKDGTSFAALNGLDILADNAKGLEIIESVKCQSQGSSWGQFEIVQVFSIVVSNEGTEETWSFNSTTRSADFGENLAESCLINYENDKKIVTKCNSVSADTGGWTITSDQPGTQPRKIGNPEFLKLTVNNQESLQGSKDPWFESGTQEITLNEWTGNITYKGSKSDPSVLLSNGTRQIELSLQAETGSSLAGEQIGTRLLKSFRNSLW